MKTIILTSILLFFSCKEKEVVLREYVSPKYQINILVLPFKEEGNFKSAEDRKNSKYFSMGVGIASNLQMLLKNRIEFRILDLQELYRAIRMEQLMGTESPKVKELQKFFMTATIDWVVTGTYAYNDKTDLINISAEIFNNQDQETKISNNREVKFSKGEYTTSPEEVTGYKQFMEQELYYQTVREILCKNVILTTCSVLSPEEMEKIKLSESKNLEAFLTAYQGIISKFNMVLSNLSELEAERERKRAFLYFKRALLLAITKGEPYPFAQENLISTLVSRDVEFMEYQAELAAFTVSSYNYSDPFKNDLNEDEVETLRRLISRIVYFVKLNPGYEFLIRGNWSRAKDNSEFRSKNLRSENLLKKLIRSTQEEETWRMYIKTQDVLSEEDSVEFLLQNKTL